MICKNCSAEFDDSLQKCPECGADIKVKFVVNIPDSEDFSQSEEVESSEETEKEITFVESEADSETDASEYEDKEYTPDEYVPEEYVPQDNELTGETVEDGFDKAESDETEKETADSSEDQEEEESQEKSEENNISDELSKVKKVAPPVKKKRPAPQKNQRMRPVQPVTKKEKQTANVIMAIMSFIGVIAIALSFVRMNTDVFKTTEPEQKAVAAAALSEQAETELETLLAKSFSVAADGFNCNEVDGESFIGKINPFSKGNIYSRFYSETVQLQTTADPLDRFGNEQGVYEYCKIEKSRIDDILLFFDLECHAANCKDYYCHDGFYYFAKVKGEKIPEYSADIKKSKRVLDGSYYLEYQFIDTGNVKGEADTYYALVGEKAGLADSAASFVIKQISKTPIFDAAGNQVEQEKNIRYKIKKIAIEGKTDSGKSFCKYIIEYPVFVGENTAYDSINRFFEDSISVYRLKADSAQKSYEEFKAQGGNDSDLPLTETVVARVTFEDDKYISIVEKISSEKVSAAEEQPETTEADGSYDEYYGYYDSYEETTESTTAAPEKPEAKVTCVNSVEAYMFDKSTGDFASKDVLAGKDYMLTSNILYRIYYSYDYAGILPEKKEENETTDPLSESSTEESTQEYYDEYYEDGYGEEESYAEESYYDDTPEDIYGIGTLIYESACALTEEGLTFYYIGDKGYIEKVTIPSEVLERLAV